MEFIENKTGVIYARVPSKDQVDGTSLEMQQQFCSEYADRNNITVEPNDIFVDKGESAKTANRPEFNKALARCSNKKKKVNYFIVYKIDRFARNQDDHVTVRAMLKRNGTDLRSVTEPIDETPIGRAMEGVLSVFAEFDNNVRTERTKQGMEERVKQGVWVWPCPIGYYRPIPHQNIAPDPKYIQFINDAFNYYSQGIYTFRATAEYLNSKGYTTKLGKKITTSYIEKLLRNPIYSGVIRVWDKDFQGTFEPIVSKEVFDKCQSGYFKKTSHSQPRSLNNAEFPLRGDVVCTECNQTFTGSNSTNGQGRKFPYYHHQKSGCINSKSIPKATFEQLFVELLDGISPTFKFEKLFKAVVIDIWQNNYKLLDSENRIIRKDINALENERQKVFNFHRNGQYTDEEFEEQKLFLNNQIKQKNLQLQTNVTDGMNMEEALDYCFNFVRDTAKTWGSLKTNYKLRLNFQRLILKNPVPFNGESFGTPNLSLIYNLNQQFEEDKSSLVDHNGG